MIKLDESKGGVVCECTSVGATLFQPVANHQALSCTWNKTTRGELQDSASTQHKHGQYWKVRTWLHLWTCESNARTSHPWSEIGMHEETMQSNKTVTRLWAFAGKLRRGDVSPQLLSISPSERTIAWGWTRRTIRSQSEDHSLELGRYAHDGFCINKNQE
jgi:hypothetical protein